MNFYQRHQQVPKVEISLHLNDRKFQVQYCKQDVRTNFRQKIYLILHQLIQHRLVHRHRHVYYQHAIKS